MNQPTILFEDTDLIVLDKPAGMTVNNADTTREELTVQEWTAKHLNIEGIHIEITEEEKKEYLSKKYFEWAFHERGGIVHRLDKETSGILLIAKHPTSFAALQKQFKERTVQKFYTALAHGNIKPPEGEINVPVGRLPWNRKQFGVVAGGREALTFYKSLAHYKTTDKRKEIVTLLELEPKTGRTHQIRVHLKYINHPIFADFLYAGRKTSREDRKVLSRVFLHASRISFHHPVTQEPMNFSCSLSVELQEVLDSSYITKLD